MLGIFACIGAMAASLYVIVTALMAVGKARASGVWVGKSSRTRVERKDDPQRFEALVRGRLAGLGVPVMVLVGAGVLLASQILSLIEISRRP
jgi:hypothetical protein